MRRAASAIQYACDFYLARAYYGVVCFVLAVVVMFTGQYGRRLSADWEQWTIGEWLINYASGFVRRGLSGELLLFVSRHSGLPANLVVFGALFLLAATFCILFALLLRNKQITFWYLFLCLSPASLLFTFYNRAAIGRKELLVFVAFAAWAHLLARRREARLRLHILFGVLSFVLTLMHELFFFFTPYFVFLSFLVSRRRHADDWKMSLLVPGCSLLALLPSLALSGNLTDPALCERLTAIGAPAKVCEGILSYSDAPATAVLEDFIGHFETHTLVGVLLIFPIVLVPVYLFLAANAGPEQSASRLVWLFCAFILFSSPLFVLAVDWGRWVSIHVVLLTVTCSFLLRNREQPSQTSARPAHLSAVHLAVGVLILSSTLCWSVKYCCGDDLLDAFGPLQAISSVWRDLDI